MDATGQIDLDDLRRAITRDTILISVMHANNEVDTTQPVEDCAAIARAYGVLSHTDAAQSGGKIPARVDELGVDLLTIAGHKLYALKGVGALYIRNAVALEPLIHGTDHERGRRAGTESALLDAALGEAGSLARSVPEMARVKELRDHFWTGLQEHFVKDVVRNGHPEERLPNTLNVSFTERVGAEILRMLEGVAAPMGSACHSGKVEPSPVLETMGVPPEIGMGAVRFSLGRETSKEEIDTVIEKLAETLPANG